MQLFPFITCFVPIVYLVFYFGLPVFFGQKAREFSWGSIRSLFFIILLSAAVYAVVPLFPTLSLGNRFMHFMGGGVMAMFLYFCALRDSGVVIGRLQFLVFGFLLVSTLGVVNELFEFFLQTTTGRIFSPNSLDTWFDLTSNTLGMVVAGSVLWPFVKKEK